MYSRRDFIKTGSLAFAMCANGAWALSFDSVDVEGSEFNNCIPFRKKPRTFREVVPGFLWADAADFQNYGGWALDTQHVGFMGSSYLIAQGTSKTVSDATLKLKAVKPGKYRLWVRSRNWIPEHAPGTFGVAVNGKDSGKTFGAQKEKGWVWQDGGVHELTGSAKLTLQDKTGFFGRCSSIILTRDLNYQPPKKVEAFKSERARLSGVSNTIKRGGSYDVIVVGAGPAGGPAAIAAARTGARTALVTNRPVLGGNASAELGVPVQGAAKKHPGKPVRETGIIEEAGRIELHGITDEEMTKLKANLNITRSFKTLVDAEPQLDLYENFWLEGVKKKGGRITEVILVDTLTGERKSLSGNMFIDCTGDAWLGHHAGADERVGREAFSEYQEEGAPEKADHYTMSACLRVGRRNMRQVNFQLSSEHKTPQAFTPPPWLYELPEEWLNGRAGGGSLESQHQRLASWAVGGTWWFEHPGDVDDLWDPEFARDELIRVNLTMWNYFKNHWEERGRLANYSLDHLGFMAGKRESRRLMGDLVLNANDAIENRQFDDVIGHTGWTLDVHHHLGILSTEGPFTINTKIPIGQIPYRCLYSRNIENLFMAGRCASVTHLALGTVRIQATCAVTGQAAGTAAGMALKYKTTPRGIYQKHMGELQQLLLKNDQYVPGIPNRDPADFALGAKVTATSNQSTAANVVNGIARPTLDGKTNTWESDPKQSLPQSIELTLKKPSKVGAIQCVFDTDLTVSMPTQRSNRVPKECVRDYTLECHVNGKWQRVVSERDNFQRFRRHQFKQVLADKVRLTVEATNGAKTARVVELRVYSDATPMLKG